MHTPRVVAFIGEIGAGKTTAAKYVANRHKLLRLAFAGPLKEMLKQLGLSEEQVNGSLKETPCDLLCGKTPRKAMQLIGTEWGRDLIGAPLWANVWSKEADYRLKKDCSIVVDDARFNNEFQVIRDRGGVFVRVERPGERSVFTGHASEEDHRLLVADYTIENDGSLPELLTKVDAAIAYLSTGKNVRISGEAAE